MQLHAVCVWDADIIGPVSVPLTNPISPVPINDWWVPTTAELTIKRWG
jgi:hypothetical protein